MTAWEDLKARGLEDARTVMAGRDDLMQLVSQMRAWMVDTRDVYKGNRSEVAEHPATQRLAEAFAEAGLLDVACHLRLFAEETGPIRPGEWLFAVLLGTASAGAFVESIRDQVWYEGNLWGHETSGAWQAFKDEIVILIASNDAARDAAWIHFDGLVDQARRDPILFASSVDRRTTGIANALSDFAAHPDLKEAWETRLDAFVLFRKAFFLKLMGRIDGRRYLSGLARLPHPVFVQQALDAASSGTDLVALLRAAPTGFDQTGRFEHDGIVIVALLRGVESSVRRAAWNGREAPELHEDRGSVELAAKAAAAALEPLLDAVFARPDAVPLGWAWLENLMHEVERRGIWRIDRQQGDGIVVDAALLLIHAIAQRLVLREDLREWVLGRESLWRIDRFMAVLAVALWARETTPHQIEALLDWALLEAELEFPGAHDAIALSGGIVGRIGAAALLVSADPAGLLRSLWQRSRPVRERAWRGGDAVGARIHAGLLLAFWGLRTLELSDGPARQQLEAQIEMILLDAYQTERSSGLERFWSGAMRRFARSMHLPPESDALEARLTSFLRPLVRPDGLFLELIVCLAERGIDLRNMRRSLAVVGVDLDWIVNAFFAAENLRIQQDVYSALWLEKVRSMASASPPAAASHQGEA